MTVIEKWCSSLHLNLSKKNATAAISNTKISIKTKAAVKRLSVTIFSVIAF
jgi:hypothetical protein